MKKLVCIVVLSVCAWSASAQHYIGAKVGYGAMQGRFYPVKEGGMQWGRYTGGVMWKYYSAQQVVGGVSAELEYQMRGYKIITEGIRSDTTNYTMKTRTVSSVTLPLIWQPHLYMANRHVRLFLNAGFTLTYNLGTGDDLTTFTQTVYDNGGKTFETETVPYMMETSRDVRWNYGFLGGFGVGVLFGRMEVFAEARYYYGMSDILRTKTKYVFNEEGSIRSELDNLFVTVGVFFRLGKGGIKEPPLRRARVASPNETDFRNIKISY